MMIPDAIYASVLESAAVAEGIIMGTGIMLVAVILVWGVIEYLSGR